MHRLFVLPECIRDNKVTITDKQARQLKQVLRFRPGDHIVVLDNTGLEYYVKVIDITDKQVVGELLGTRWCTNGIDVEIILYQALLKGDKFEMVLQKCTELGVSAFVPILCERCVVGAPGPSKLNRWQKIITEAAEQSGRGKLPHLHAVTDFEHACDSADGGSLLPWEGERVMGIGSALQFDQGGQPPKLNVFVGPEGGFSDEEAEFARMRGITPVTLGKLTLRAGTAGLVATSAILYEYGEMNAG